MKELARHIIAMNKGEGMPMEAKGMDMDDPMEEHDYFHSMANELITAVHGHNPDSVREILKNCANHLMDSQYNISNDEGDDY